MAVVLCDGVFEGNRLFAVAFREAQLRAAFARVAIKAQQARPRLLHDGDLAVRTYLIRSARARSVWAVHPLLGNDEAAFAGQKRDAHSPISNYTIFDTLLLYHARRACATLKHID